MLEMSQKLPIIISGSNNACDYSSGGNWESAVNIALDFLSKEQLVYIRDNRKSADWVMVNGYMVRPVPSSNALTLIKQLINKNGAHFKIMDCSLYKKDCPRYCSSKARTSQIRYVIETSQDEYRIKNNKNLKVS